MFCMRLWQHWTDHILSFSWFTVYKPCLRNLDANNKVSKPVWINYDWRHLGFISDIVLKKTLKIPTLVSKYRWCVPLPLSWIGQYAACTVSTEAGVLVLPTVPSHGLVRLGVACFSSNRKCVIRTKYKPTPNTKTFNINCLIIIGTN
jgi:hypothetical protein